MRARTLCLIALPVAAGADPLPTIPFQSLTLDPAHASITATVNHLGFSNYTVSFDRFDAQLDFGTDRPGDTQLWAGIDVASLDLPAPPDGFLDTMLGADWFDAARFQQITFTSDTVTQTGDATARVSGTLTMRGQSAPVAFDVTFNGGYADAPWEPYARIGFSATGTLDRAVFGMTNGIPAPGTTLGVGGAVSFAIEAEFVGTPPD